MRLYDCQGNPDWLPLVLDDLRYLGFAVVTGVLPPVMVEKARRALYAVQRSIQAELGRERLAHAGELGVLRLMVKYEPYFLRFLELPELLAVLDQTVSPTAILHVQNG